MPFAAPDIQSAKLFSYVHSTVIVSMWAQQLEVFSFTALHLTVQFSSWLTLITHLNSAPLQCMETTSAWHEDVFISQ